MIVRFANALWNGTLKEDKGVMNFSEYNGPFTFANIKLVCEVSCVGLSQKLLTN